MRNNPRKPRNILLGCLGILVILAVLAGVGILIEGFLNVTTNHCPFFYFGDIHNCGCGAGWVKQQGICVPAGSG